MRLKREGVQGTPTRWDFNVLTDGGEQNRAWT